MLACVLFTVQLALLVLEHTVLAKDTMKSISDHYGEGLSMCNWYIPDLKYTLIIGTTLKCLIAHSRVSKELRD